MRAGGAFFRSPGINVCVCRVLARLTPPPSFFLEAPYKPALPPHITQDLLLGPGAELLFTNVTRNAVGHLHIMGTLRVTAAAQPVVYLRLAGGLDGRRWEVPLITWVGGGAAAALGLLVQVDGSTVGVSTEVRTDTLWAIVAPTGTPTLTPCRRPRLRGCGLPIPLLLFFCDYSHLH